METRASYFLVGLFVFVLIAGLFFFVLWLSKAELRDERIYYYIYFRGSVTGLQVGSPVRLRGVPVGTVTDIAIDAANVELIEVTVGLKPGTPVKTDTVASLQLQGITGLSFVQLEGGTQAAPPLEPRPGKRRAVIPSAPSRFERLFEDVPQLVAQIHEVATRVTILLNDQNLSRIEKILVDAERFTGTLAEVSGDVAILSRDAAVTMRELRQMATTADALAGELREIAGRLGGDSQRVVKDIERVLAEVSTTARSFRRVAEQLDGTVGENRQPLRDFSTSGLYELSQFLVEARSLVASMQRLVAQIERDPARFLFGDQQKGFEAK